MLALFLFGWYYLAWRVLLTKDKEKDQEESDDDSDDDEEHEHDKSNPLTRSPAHPLTLISKL